MKSGNNNDKSIIIGFKETFECFLELIELGVRKEDIFHIIYLKTICVK